MIGWSRGMVFGLLVTCSACGGPMMSAAASRSFADGVADDLRQPVCFAPPDPRLGLIERSNATSMLSICERAALSQHVAVVPFGQQDCLVATASWTARDTGDFASNCGRTFGGGQECSSAQVRHKSIKLTLSNSKSVVVAETMATISSTLSGFNDRSFFALCGAAFHEYPRPLRNAQFDVATE
jgi:hypothetical protein